MAKWKIPGEAWDTIIASRLYHDAAEIDDDMGNVWSEEDRERLVSVRNAMRTLAEWYGGRK